MAMDMGMVILMVMDIAIAMDRAVAAVVVVVGQAVFCRGRCRCRGRRCCWSLVEVVGRSFFVEESRVQASCFSPGLFPGSQAGFNTARPGIKSRLLELQEICPGLVQDLPNDVRPHVPWEPHGQGIMKTDKPTSSLCERWVRPCEPGMFS